MIRSRLAFAAIVTCTFALTSPAAFGVDTNWTGLIDGLWSTPGNWSAGVPTASDNVFLTAPVTSNPTITILDPAVANRLTANGSGYTVTGGTLTLSDNLYVDSTSGSLAISGGASVSSPNATVGISAGNSGNELSVASRLSVPGTLNVGFDGTGNALRVLAGGSVAAGGLWVGGVSTAANNAVTVAAGGGLQATSNVIVGYGGDTSLLQVAGVVSSAQTFLGYDSGADGNVVLVSAGGRWANPGALTVGRLSSGNSFRVTSGTLTVTGTANDVIIGDDAAASGNSIAVTGGTFSSQAALVIGRSGTGNSFVATGGARVSNANARIGLNAGSVWNTGTVSGAGTEWTITNKLRVGSDGNNNALVISSGGVVSVASDVFVGGTSTGSAVSGNSITVTGSGSKLAILSPTADLVIAYGTGTSNVVSVAESGTLAVSSVRLGPAGTLEIGLGGAAGFVNQAATIDAPLGGGQVVFNHSDAAYSFANPITGSTRVVQRGSGKTTLSGSSSYTGATLVSAGTLALAAASNPIASSGTIDVAAASVLDVSSVTGGFVLASGQTLSGAGLVTGGVTGTAGSIVSPGGAAVNTLTFASTLNLLGTLAIDVSGTTADLAAVGGLLTLDPASTVSFTVGSPLTEPAYVFASYNSLLGTFGNVTGLPTGYALDYNYLGGKQVALVAVPEPGTLILGSTGCLFAAFSLSRRSRRGRGAK
ncbi:MAG: beta strand repeat-containing protein [Planctomycetaceae bacterium]